jgi:hypothetical protein
MPWTWNSVIAKGPNCLTAHVNVHRWIVLGLGLGCFKLGANLSKNLTMLPFSSRACATYGSKKNFSLGLNLLLLPSPLP